MHSNHVLPFYVVCDVSYSMMDHIDALNDSLREFHSAIGTDPSVADAIRFCLIGFSESPEIVTPLGRLGEITELSGLTARASSNFGAVFSFLRDTIARDLRLLSTRCHGVHRPAVFFLSDGQPTDPSDWPARFAALTDSSWFACPNVTAFGIGDADPVTIGRIGTYRTFLGHDGVSPGAALHGVVRMLIVGRE